MAHWETARRWLIRLFLGGLLLLLAGCPGGPGGGNCGGVDDRATCVTITSIQPMDGGGTATSDVDVTFNPDCNGDGISDDPEVFTRHDATVNFANTKFPTANAGLSVTIHSFTVSYSLVTCPSGAVCPPLSPFSENINLAIAEDGTSSTEVSLVPINVKNEFNNQGGSASAFPIYSANYTFSGETNFFEDSLTVQGNVAFVMGNFNSCP